MVSVVPVIAACVVAGVFVVLLVGWQVYARWLRNGGSFGFFGSAGGVVDLTNEHGEIDPVKQIKHLKRSTAEFGIRYEELKFGKMLGKGSQGEVFKATWRGSTVAVKKVDTRKVPPEIIEEFWSASRTQPVAHAYFASLPGSYTHTLLAFACCYFHFAVNSQEAQIMRRLRHPTLTLFMGVSLEHPSVTLDACVVLCARTRVL
jgi:hypothetical protein